MTSDTKIAPKALRPSSTIAILSPSARLNNLLPKRVSLAIGFFSSLGFKVKLNDKPLSRTATLKESIEQRVKEIHEAFIDPEVQAIVCSLGGPNCNELLNHLDYNLIKANPKILCGFSDITYLHYALYTQSDLRTFYGPTALTQFAEFPSPLDTTASHFMKILTNPSNSPGNFPLSKEYTDESATQHWFTPNDLKVARPMKPNSGWRWVRRGKAKGIMFGGTLPLVVRLGGTPFDLPSYNDVILLLELPEGEPWEDHPAYPILNAKAEICDLANRGIFQQIAGLVLGRSFGFTEDMNTDFEDHVVQVIEVVGRSEGECPVLAGVDVGHTDPMVTVPLGAKAELDSEQGIWQCVQAVVV
ncbi:hypothetical protein CVT26_004993 [Gymnopilus dilepis]|uniref:LD-carboxypeptidase n=1 Tax=Gymnopilus dilepis TaxID=231916 RepID=A0A409Y095_9AGAR|nr:hypothetical protein CVT26_004993 [Gymnopilus dilepis]